MSEWRDISTAPRDGTKILLGWPGVINMGRGDVRGFYALNTATYFHPEQPTHWHALPDPPASGVDPKGNAE